MIYGSVCSGIEAASVAWHPLGWRPAFFAEIEKFPRAVLARHYPDVPLHGDFTTINEGDYEPIDLLVGGTPCQSFSVAGLRQGLDDERGNLALEFVRLADRLRPRWLVWENVPGVLSIDGGRAFGAFLGGLAHIGYGFAYRVLDAQYFGLAQRRARVFVVGCLGDWRGPAAVLFKPESLRGDSPPGREAGAAVAALTANGVGICGADDNQGQAGHLIAFGGNNTAGPIDVATALNACGTASGRMDFESETFIASTLTASYGSGAGQDLKNDGLLIAHALRAGGFDASEDGTGRGTPLVPVAFQCHGGNVGEMGVLRAGNGNSSGCVPFIAFDCKASADFQTFSESGVTPTLRAMGKRGSHDNAGVQLAVAIGHNGGPPLDEPGERWAVRRLTPRECERLQGFPDDYTMIPWRGKPADQCPDGPRYRSNGNSMATKVMRWIGERIARVDAIMTRGAA